MEFPNSEIQMAWPPGPPVGELPAGEVHVWSARLVRPDEDYAAGLASLSPEEQTRARMFQFERDRRAFISRRSLVRVILAAYLRTEPSKVSLTCEERGKPRLSGDPQAPALHFNLSHSGHLALLAVSRSSAVGVDVERIRPMPEMSETAANFFSPAENARLAAAGPEEKLPVFYGIWTRKEAYLKATGEGIAAELATLDCSEAPAGWSLYTLSPAPGFAAALASRAGGAAPVCRRWGG